jgi:hypothetical protein
MLTRDCHPSNQRAGPVRARRIAQWRGVAPFQGRCDDPCLLSLPRRDPSSIISPPAPGGMAAGQTAYDAGQVTSLELLRTTAPAHLADLSQVRELTPSRVIRLCLISLSLMDGHPGPRRPRWGRGPATCEPSPRWERGLMGTSPRALELTFETVPPSGSPPVLSLERFSNPAASRLAATSVNIPHNVRPLACTIHHQPPRRIDVSA